MSGTSPWSGRFSRIRASGSATSGRTASGWPSITPTMTPRTTMSGSRPPASRCPTGEYANVARRNFDREVFGTIWQYQKSGWSNDSSFVAEVTAPLFPGLCLPGVLHAEQRAARGGQRVGRRHPAGDQLVSAGSGPGRAGSAQPASDLPARYRDSQAPGELELDRGSSLRQGQAAGPQFQRLDQRSDRRLADRRQRGARQPVLSQLPTSMWGPLGNVEVYGKKYPIQDCRSGVCYDGYLYYNGYIPANRINSVGANGRPNGVMGVPDELPTFQTPLIPDARRTAGARAIRCSRSTRPTRLCASEKRHPPAGRLRYQPAPDAATSSSRAPWSGR